MKSVESSTIRAIGYDEKKRELHVDFHSSGTYIYHDVPPETHEALMGAESHGKHIHQFIKGVHSHRKT